MLHFQGKKEIKKDVRHSGFEDIVDSHGDARKLYTSPRVRPTTQLIEQQSKDKQDIYHTAKEQASYWLGLLSYDTGNHKVAADWFARRTLEPHPDGPWTDGARYNLARSYEKLDRLDDAVDILQKDSSPQRHGNLLRAQRLTKQKEQ